MDKAEWKALAPENKQKPKIKHGRKGNLTELHDSFEK